MPGFFDKDDRQMLDPYPEGVYLTSPAWKHHLESVARKNAIKALLTPATKHLYLLEVTISYSYYPGENDDYDHYLKTTNVYVRNRLILNWSRKIKA